MKHLPSVLLVVVCLLMVAATGATGAAAQVQRPLERPPGGWKQIGPATGFPVEQFAVSPNWPVDQFLIAAASGRMVHSADGGATWERGERPAIGVESLTVAPGTTDQRIVFAVGSSALGQAYGLGIARSTDGGISWATTLSVPATKYRIAAFSLSPTFDQDGFAFATFDGALYRSRDFGATWTPIDPVPGQRVQGIALSPMFATDHTLVAAAVTGVFPVPWEMGQDKQKALHHESSAGVAVSTDGGDTWQVSSTGLAVDGASYRYVQGIVISPTFAEDSVIFAYAWGPWSDDAVPSAIFRSEDRGQNWTLAWRRDDGKDQLQFSSSFALSPTFAMDGVGQVALPGLSSWNSGPHGVGPCPVYSTVDGGRSWSLVAGRDDRSPGCFELRTAVASSGGRVAYSTDHPGEGRERAKFRSFDDGATWEQINPPVRGPITGTWRSTVAGDGTFFVGTQDGIWALAPDSR